MRTILLCGSMFLASCAAVDRQQLASASQFTPGQNGFTFVAEANTNMQEDNPKAEAQRLLVMSQFNERNGTCANGYTVADRAVARRPPTALGVKTLAQITYRARCN